MLADEVKNTIQELRELAHGIYPPLLADSGLGEALRAAANRSPLAVTVTADGIGRYTPDIEAAVYFCCLEALQNAGKHAPQARVEVRVWEESGGLLFSVTDDGPGFDAASARKGHGFVNMADRLGRDRRHGRAGSRSPATAPRSWARSRCSDRAAGAGPPLDGGAPVSRWRTSPSSAPPRAGGSCRRPAAPC